MKSIAIVAGTVGARIMDRPEPSITRARRVALPPAPAPDTRHGTVADAGQLTVNGELNKLGHNVSFGQGIHAGIHFRSDTDTSLLPGEAVALNFLRNRARTYNEPFTVKIARFVGSIATIANAGNS